MANVTIVISDDLIKRFQKCIEKESEMHEVDWNFEQFLIRSFNIAVSTYEVELNEFDELYKLQKQSIFSEEGNEKLTV